MTQDQLSIDSYPNDKNALAFCDDFFQGSSPRYILGRNQWARSIADVVDVDGFIDDFTTEREFVGKPILKIEDLPPDAMVVSTVVGVIPITAQKKLIEQKVSHIDYFAFRKYSGKKLSPVWFWDDFLVDFQAHADKYQWIYSLLADEQSKQEFTKIINFRLSSHLSYMDGFVDAQYRQYFEDFLALQPWGETFLDVGGFDGYTSLEFIKRCPDHAGVHIFEPEPKNMEVIQHKMGELPRVHFHNYGLSNCSQTLRFFVNGSASRITADGETEIPVKALDEVVSQPFSFLKMDIEGGEMFALAGAKQAIINHHPRLAISAYHRHDDFWRIPELVLSYRDDYQIFFRHYTEGVTETVLFFVPQ